MTAVYEISGRVQGVGFRTFVQAAARELAISGSALNLPDGRIRVEAKGATSRVRELEKRLRVGPAGAQVSQVVKVEGDLEPGEPYAQGVEQGKRGPWREDGRDRAVVAIGVGRISTLPELPAATDLATRVGEWARSSQGIPRENVLVFTDERGPVTGTSVSDGVASLVERGSLRQIIVYFAGYAVNLRNEETLLLTDAPRDTSEAIDVAAMAAIARGSGIEHVVLITDACRVAAGVIGAMPVNAVSLFPAVSLERPSGVVDRFISVAALRPAYAERDVSDAVRRFSGDYTRLMLSALDGQAELQPEFRDGGAYVTARALHRYLRVATERQLITRGPSVRELPAPDARIESGDDQFVARVVTHLPPPFPSPSPFPSPQP